METLNFVTLTFETLTVIALEKHKPSKQIKFSQFYLESITGPKEFADLWGCPKFFQHHILH
ncbi:hypothetical protein CUMW_253900 [Citrus unshiu]|uniref:Uncharacterized protein n=1 Tax=Citrus unshiu TaxID=55188 RepID=A0A2H5QRA1_CITUN|nr:hypothetical protein CUMW_253900 [Citrus unshiu]